MRSLRTVFVVIALAAVSVFLTSNVFADTLATTITTDPNAGVAAAVQSYFSDIPIMIAIAKCESGPRQFENNGTPLLGGTGTMVGVFQLDETIHYAKALALGFDIDTLAGNLGYARYLYGAEGTEPWISSFGCWQSALATTTAPGVATTTSTLATTTGDVATASAPPALTLDLSLGSIDPQVLILQQMLNAAGFILATSGPGSPGNETTKFGALTYTALKKFQCAQGIACSGEEATTGYGLLNAATRAALLATAAASTSTIISTTTVGSAPADDNAAEVAELQSRIAALVAIVAQLEAEIAAR